jgi:hypothetical protein
MKLKYFGSPNGPPPAIGSNHPHRGVRSIHYEEGNRPGRVNVEFHNHCNKCDCNGFQNNYRLGGKTLCYLCWQESIRCDEQEKNRARTKAADEQAAAMKRQLDDHVAATLNAAEEAKKQAERRARQEEEAHRNMIYEEVQRILAQEKRQREEEESRQNEFNAEVQRLFDQEKHKKSEAAKKEKERVEAENRERERVCEVEKANYEAAMKHEEERLYSAEIEAQRQELARLTKERSDLLKAQDENEIQAKARKRVADLLRNECEIEKEVRRQIYQGEVQHCCPHGRVTGVNIWWR